MQISFWFIVILVIIILPGLIFRRLYYYNEFSKQFNAGHNIIQLISISSIPGIFILVLVVILYANFVSPIDFSGVIDILKDVSNPDKKTVNINFKGEKINKIIQEDIIPFVGYLYIISIFLGVLSGRLVRFTKIDTKLKFLRFNNTWFYLFRAHHTDFKKMKHLKEKGKKYLFTKADILIDGNNGAYLYSGVVVDYELDENSCRNLKKVILHDAKRYKIIGNKRTAVEIPGSLFVVDCSTMKNINLTYVLQKQEKQKINWPVVFDNISLVITIVLLPIFLIKSEIITWKFYQHIFHFSWIVRVVVYILILQIVSLLNPYVEINGEYKRIDNKTFGLKILGLVFLLLILWLSGVF